MIVLNVIFHPTLVFSQDTSEITHLTRLLDFWSSLTLIHSSMVS